MGTFSPLGDSHPSTASIHSTISSAREMGSSPGIGKEDPLDLVLADKVPVEEPLSVFKCSSTFALGDAEELRATCFGNGIYHFILALGQQGSPVWVV